MPSIAFAEELARFGPHRGDEPACSLSHSRDYCRRLALTHYENFTVASWLLPRHLRQHFYNVYAYCRWADDLADETGSARESLDLLDWWSGELERMNDGCPRHPVFVALADTVREFDIPPDPLRDLLVAFRQDQRVRRYETFEELLDYCRYSANPVGRLVLYLGRCHDEVRGQLADSICTGLQLANFWQDVARDFERGRVYLPQSTLRTFGCSADSFPQSQATPEFRRALAFEVARAEGWFECGLPLVNLMPRGLKGDVWLFAHGGLKILAKIRAQQYDVWTSRPEVSKLDQFGLLAGCLMRNWWPGQRRAA